MAAFMVAVIAASSPAAAAGVDLAVVTPDITFSNNNPVDGQNVTILVIVRNFGDVNATGVVLIATETGTPNLVGQAQLASVPAQGSAQAGISWNVTGVGVKSVTVSVSSAEVDANPDNNNAVSTTITVRARPDVSVNSVTFDNPTPPAFSTSVEVRVQLGNTGGSNATSVVLYIYDGDPQAGGTEIYHATLALVPTDGPVTATYTWNIVNKGGRHDIYAQVLSTVPAEYPEGTDNNIGSGQLLVLTGNDIEVTGDRQITYSPQLNGFLIIRSGGNLTLRDCTLTILQERDNQFGVIIEDGGRLAMVGAEVISDHAFGLTLRSGGVFGMSGGSDFGGSVTSEGGTLSADDSVIEGGLDGNFANLMLSIVAVRGDVSLMNTVATFEEVAFEGPNTVELDGSSVMATNLSIPQAVPNALHAGAGTVAQLYGIASGAIVADPGATVSIFRFVTLHVLDFTGIPIGNATVSISFALSQAPAGSVVTATDGTAAVWLLTDELAGSAPQYSGSYLFDATYASYHAQAAANLPFYPTLSVESNSVDVTVVFGVINPSDLFPVIDGDKTVSAGTQWNVGEFTQDGNLRIQGTVNVNGGTFMLDQDRDFEKAIVLNGGTFNMSGVSLMSNHKFNIYLFGASKLVATGTTINCNAVVVFDSATVSAADGSSVNCNLILPGGSSLTIGAGSEARGDLLWARGGPSLVFRGALIAMRTVDVATTADISLNGTSMQFAGAAVLHSLSPTSTLTANNSAFVGGTADLEAGRIDVSGTEFGVSAITRLWAGTVQMASTAVHGTISGLKPGSSGAFYDVTYDSIDADPTAVINIFHTLSFAVLDVNGNAVTDGTFAIRAMPNGTTDLVSGSLAQLVSRSLHAATIRGGIEVFDGNYRLTVDLGDQDLVEFVVMDGQKTITYNLPQEVVAPTNVDITATPDPATLGRADNISITGTVSLRYAGRAASLLPRAPMTLTIRAGTVVIGTVQTMADGSYNWTGNLTALDEGVTGTVQITVSGSYQGVAGTRDIFVDILVPAPTELLLTLDNVRFQKRENEDFILSGVVKFGNDVPAPGVKVRVYFTIPPQAQEYFATTDSNGLWSVTVPGRRTASTYSISVVAFDEQYNLFSTTQGVTVEVLGAVSDTGGDFGELTLPIIIAVIAVAAGVVVFLLFNAKRRSVNYVECGNCGRPVHEGESKCPSCGVEFEEDIAKCSHCASWIPADAMRCPKCNTEFKPVDDSIAGGEGTEEAPDTQEPVRAEVTTTAEPVRAVKQPVAVKKKVLKRAVEPGKEEGGSGGDAPDPFADSDSKKADDLVTDKPEGGEGEKKDKEKGLFDDL